MFKKPKQIIVMRIYDADGQFLGEKSKIVYQNSFSRLIFVLIMAMSYVIFTQAI